MKQSRYATLFLLFFVIGALLWAGGSAVAQQAPEPPDGRLIIKDGYVEIMVPDVGSTSAALEQMASTYDAYILTQETWEDGDRNPYASYRFGLPASQFELMFTSAKGLGMVQNAESSGREVTDTAVNLTSRLENLYANQARLKSFLEDARTVTETLKVHEQLIRIEQDINELQGELRGVSGRSEAATLTVLLIPVIPTPTPLPTATPTPLPTPEVWRPGDTAKIASVDLRESVQDSADFAIYRGIVCVPWLVILLVVGVPLYMFVQRRRRRT